MGALGIGLAMVAGATLATGDTPVAITAAILSGACGVLCVLADETRRESAFWP